MRPDQHGPGAYVRLVAMLLFSYAAMFALMYAMVDVFENVVPNLNQFYMAGLMTAPMLLIEIWLMRAMYPNKRLNMVLAGLGVVMLAGFWMGIREQIAVSDKQFLKSMIPHHAGAILMCEQADLKVPKVQELCNGIITAQKKEISEMRSIIEELQTKR